jgi:uncharacterized coiled-coil protein SlyX
MKNKKCIRVLFREVNNLQGDVIRLYKYSTGLGRRIDNLEERVDDSHERIYHLWDAIAELRGEYNVLGDHIKALEEAKEAKPRPWYSYFGEVHVSDAPPAGPKERSLYTTE